MIGSASEKNESLDRSILRLALRRSGFLAVPGRLLWNLGGRDAIA
jgi:hypothetical protein